MTGIFHLSPVWFWAVILIVCVVAEAATVSLVSIWFAAGSLGALLAAAIGFGIPVQCAVFAVLSFLLLVLLRPIVEKVLKPKKDRTNADRIFGEKAVVIQTIDNRAGTGQIRLFSQVWTARTVKDGIVVPEGETVYVDGISGVKAMVVLTPEELGGCKV